MRKLPRFGNQTGNIFPLHLLRKAVSAPLISSGSRGVTSRFLEGNVTRPTFLLFASAPGETNHWRFPSKITEYLPVASTLKADQVALSGPTELRRSQNLRYPP